MTKDEVKKEVDRIHKETLRIEEVKRQLALDVVKLKEDIKALQLALDTMPE